MTADFRSATIVAEKTVSTWMRKLGAINPDPRIEDEMVRTVRDVLMGNDSGILSDFVRVDDVKSERPESGTLVTISEDGHDMWTLNVVNPDADVVHVEGIMGFSEASRRAVLAVQIVQ